MNRLISEEHQLLKDTIREFSEKNIENEALRIEREGLSREIVKKIADQGFLGARVPLEYGGSALDETSYLIILEELARSSPSVAARVLISNSIFSPIVLSHGNDKEVLGKVASGDLNVTVAYSELLEGFKNTSKVDLVGGRVRGTRNYILNSKAETVILAAGDPENTLVMLKGGFRTLDEHPKLGFRGLSFSPISIDSDDMDTMSTNGSSILEDALNDIDLEVSAIAIGMADGAMSKAVEYAKVRSTFGHLLKDYQPVAFSISEIMSEITIMREFLFKDSLTSVERAMIKSRAIETAKKATKMAIQFHGGYGYLQDFGVEKFYRDSMSLPILFARYTKDMKRLSELVFESESGFL